MAEHTAIPDGWTEVTYDEDDDFDALWACEHEQVAVRTEDADGTYPVIVEQTLDVEDVTVTVQSHAQVAEDRTAAERLAAEFMHEVNDGNHALRVIGIEEHDDVYEFYCLSDSELPGDMTGEQLVESIDNQPAQDDIEELPDNVDSTADVRNTLTIDIFTRHKNELTTDNDDEY